MIDGRAETTKLVLSFARDPLAERTETAQWWTEKHRTKVRTSSVEYPNGRERVQNMARRWSVGFAGLSAKG